MRSRRASHGSVRPLNCGVMRNQEPQFWFRSDLFSIDTREDEETNPFRYGRQLATWLSSQFRSLGYSPEAVIPEDWGWCVMLKRRPFMLWVGCGNVQSEFFYRMKPEDKVAFVPEISRVTWLCFVGTDVPIWTPFFWQRLLRMANTAEAVTKVGAELETLLRKEHRIQLTDEPLDGYA
jgi:hypothetical protein